MKQPNWQIEESILLVDLYFRSLSLSSVELKTEIAKLSTFLRHRGKVLGIPVDDTFRNVNGIEMRLKSIQYLVTNGSIGLDSPGKSSETALSLYKKDIDIFNTMLKECFERYK